MTDLRKRVGEAMEYAKRQPDGSVMFADVRDAAIRETLQAVDEAACKLPLWVRIPVRAFLMAFNKASGL